MTADEPSRTLAYNVTRQRILFMGGTVWELLRFFALLNVLSLGIFNFQSLSNVVDMAWFGAPQLVPAAAFFMTALYDDYKQRFLPLLRIGKLLSVLAGVSAFISGGFATPLLDPPWEAVSSITLLAILLVDSVLLIVLLLYPRETRSG